MLKTPLCVNYQFDIEARWRARLRFLLVSGAVTVLSVCKKAGSSSAIHTSTPAQAAAAYGITRWTGRLRYNVGSGFDAHNVAGGDRRKI